MPSKSRARYLRAAKLVEAKVRIAVAGENVVLRVPEIALRFIRFRGLLPFLLDGGNAFRFLVAGRAATSCHVGAFATDEQRGPARNKR